MGANEAYACAERGGQVPIEDRVLNMLDIVRVGREYQEAVLLLLLGLPLPPMSFGPMPN